jgi:hypothetical protein
VSLDTTNHDARAKFETKRQALAKVDTSTRPSKPPRWKRDPDLLAWLNLTVATGGEIMRSSRILFTKRIGEQVAPSLRDASPRGDARHRGPNLSCK